MAGLDVVQSVQFVTVKGKHLAVLSADDWETLMERLETLEDLQTAQTAYAELKAANGDRKRAGWLKRDEMEQEADDYGDLAVSLEQVGIRLQKTMVSRS